MLIIHILIIQLVITNTKIQFLTKDKAVLYTWHDHKKYSLVMILTNTGVVPSILLTSHVYQHVYP